MSLKKFSKDLAFGEKKEDVLIKKLKEVGWEVERWHKTSILDFNISRQPDDKRRKVEQYYIEVKSRNDVSSTTYSDSMIWANKLAAAWQKYYIEWIETIFIFCFTDWIFYHNPIEKYRVEYRRWRVDRGSTIDKPKGWAFINKLDPWIFK